MDKDIQYQGMTEEQMLEICHCLLVYCNDTLRSASEKIRASLAKCDAIDNMAGLYRTARQARQ
jgi:hypothetical protein